MDIVHLESGQIDRFRRLVKTAEGLPLLVVEIGKGVVSLAVSHKRAFVRRRPTAGNEASWSQKS